jgi:hypothetical protein
MIYIEDLITAVLAGICTLNYRDENMLDSFNTQNSQGVGLTEKQRAAAVRILRHYQKAISTTLGTQIINELANPVFKLPVRVLKVVKKISLINRNDLGKSIKVEFPYNEDKVKFIRENRDKLNYAQWDQELKAWVFSLDEASIVFLFDFVGEENYEIDEEFLEYTTQSRAIINNMENHVPMLVLENNNPKLTNLPKNSPNLVSKNIIEAVFEARRLGILTWSDEIDQRLEDLGIDTNIKTFLSTDYNIKTLINSQNTVIECLEPIINYMGPCLFVIPGGSEVEKLVMSYSFLNRMNVPNQAMSVMFRLPSEEGGNFNNFVKTHNLNSPITAETKIVFVGTKLPKSILKSKIKFNSIINLGQHSAHHTIQEFMSNHENVVIFTELSNTREQALWLLRG